MIQNPSEPSVCHAGNSLLLSTTVVFLYSSGKVTSDASANNTYFWNLLTGEFWHGPQYKQANPNVSFAESNTYAELTCSDGSIVTGDAGVELYKSLMSGKEIALVWYKATQENVNQVLR